MSATEQKFERGHLQIDEDPAEQEHIRSSDRIPPRPPDQPHGRRRPDRPPRWTGVLLAIMLIGASVMVFLAGSITLKDSLEGTRFGE